MDGSRKRPSERNLHASGDVPRGTTCVARSLHSSDSPQVAITKR